MATDAGKLQSEPKITVSKHNLCRALLLISLFASCFSFDYYIMDDELDEFNSMTVRELKDILHQKGVDYSDCVEKSDLIKRARESRTKVHPHIHEHPTQPKSKGRKEYINGTNVKIMVLFSKATSRNGTIISLDWNALARKTLIAMDNSSSLSL